MAWTNVPDANLLPDKAGRSADIIAIKDNITALANGDTGAPKIQTAAIQDGAINQNKILSPTAGTTYKIANIYQTSAGTTQTAYLDDNSWRGDDTQRRFGILCINNGTITASLQHFATSGETSYVRVLKNGVLVQEWTTTSTTPVSRSVNISITNGDVIVFQNRSLTGLSSGWQNLAIYSGANTFAVV